MIIGGLCLVCSATSAYGALVTLHHRGTVEPQPIWLCRM